VASSVLARVREAATGPASEPASFRRMPPP
jgi:hypothetical protein